MTVQNYYFIDARINDYQALISSLQTSDKWALLDAKMDGLDQMATALAQVKNLASIHIISHGAESALILGSSALNLANIHSYQTQLAAIGASLAPQGDLLLYGCNVVTGSEGHQFIQAIAQLTGADVAASTDKSGPASLGGNSALESHVGIIETASSNLENLSGVLALNIAPSFGLPGTGKVLTDIGIASTDEAYSVTVQTDGKIVVAGLSDGNFALVRYNANGSLDTSFNTTGKVVTDLGINTTDGGYAVKAQADGKLVVAGMSAGDFAVVRYNANGSLDTTFNGTGKVLTDLGNKTNDGGYALSLQADGKLVVAGFTQTGEFNNNFAVVRYNTNGSLDTSFNSTGKVVTDIGSNTIDDKAHSVIVQPDGKMVVAGASGDRNFTLARYNTNGSLDTSFNSTGKVVTDLGRWDYGYSVTLQADGKIIVAGYCANTTDNYDFAVVRYNSNGTLDTSFNGTGKVVTDIGSATKDLGQSVTVQADGKIVVAGYSNSGGSSNFTLVRYNADGSLDTTLGSTSTLEGVASYTENGLASVLDSNVQILDSELAALGSYAGASLTLARQGGASAQDLFSGAGITAGQTSGAVTVAGTGIGSYSYAAGTLTITFNSSATQSLVNQAMQSMAYNNSSDAPPASVQINWTFNDGNTGLQGTGGALNDTGSSSVNITGVNDAPTGAVTISGTAKQGQVLTAANTLADADGLGTISYQWKADGANISGATGTTLTLGQTDAGKIITVVANYTDLGGTAESVSSAATLVSGYTPGQALIDLGDQGGWWQMVLPVGPQRQRQHHIQRLGTLQRGGGSYEHGSIECIF